MRHEKQRSGGRCGGGYARWTAVVLLVAAAGGVTAQEGELVALEAAAIYPLSAESTLVIEDLQGELSVRLGKEPEVRFHSVRLEDREEGELELWSRGNSLVLRAPDASQQVPRLVQVAVPERMRVQVLLSGMKVSASGLRADLEVAGAGLELDLRGIAGAIDLDLEGGRVFVGTSDGVLSLAGREFDAELSFLHGAVHADVSETSLRMQRMDGPLELVLDGGGLDVEDAKQPIDLEAEDARVELRGLEQGGELRLRSTPVRLRECKGELTIETDDEVQFNETEASLHVNNWGGSVRGSGNTGLVEIKTEGAQVLVEKIQGPLRVQGDRLELSASEVAGELLVYVTSSTVEVDGAAAGAVVENEFGDVTVRRSKQEVRVTSRNGDVRVLEHNGTVEVDAEGPAVEVSWSSVGRDKDSRIENASGDVTLRFPPNGSCRIEARSNFGRIETDLPDVRISDDGNAAAGMLGRGTRPTVHVVSEGDLYLMSGTAAAVEE